MRARSSSFEKDRMAAFATNAHVGVKSVVFAFALNAFVFTNMLFTLLFAVGGSIVR